MLTRGRISRKWQSQDLNQTPPGATRHHPARPAAHELTCVRGGASVSAEELLGSVGGRVTVNDGQIPNAPSELVAALANERHARMSREPA